MGSDIDPKVDYAFKRINGDEDNARVLVDLLNAVIDFPPGRAVKGVMLLNPYMPKDFVGGKIPILDIRARDDPGRYFLLEMQLFVRPGLSKRELFYWADVHRSQLHQGERYETLLPTYAICFVNQTLVADEHWHHTYHVYDEEHGVRLCNDLEIHVLELNKFNVPVEQLKTSLERWCYFYKYGSTLDLDNLPATMDVPMIRKAVEVLMRISQSELERQRYLEQQRIDWDAASLAADARVAKEERQAKEEELQAKQKELQAKQEELQAKQEELQAKQKELQDVQEKAKKSKIIGRIQLLQQQLEQAETADEELQRMSEDHLRQLEESLKQQWSNRKTANGTSPSNPA